MARGRRVRLEECIYQDAYGFAVKVQVGAASHEVRFPLDTPITTLRRNRDRARQDLRDEHPEAKRGTLAHDAEAYVDRIQHLRSWRERRSEVRAWVAVFGSWPRGRIKRAHILEQRIAWLNQEPTPVAPKTINNRVFTLQDLYHTLDGRRARTPCDDIDPLAVPRRKPAGVPVSVILRIYRQLVEWEKTGRLRDQKTRARFMVLAASGVRPSELMAAEPGDVDLEARAWRTRDGKGGYRPGGLYLYDDLLEAWKLFVAADAWGEYNTGSFAEVMRHAGWPDEGRPYDMRAAVGIALSEGGADFADVGAWLGHTRLDTTREHYVPILGGRMQRAGESLQGRIAWHSAGHPQPKP